MLTIEQILNEPPGKILDLWVAYYIFNYQIAHCMTKKDKEKTYIYSLNKDGGGIKATGKLDFSLCSSKILEYSTKIKDAWLVVEKMMELKYRYVCRGDFEGNGLHWVGFDQEEWADPDPLLQSPMTKTLPEAIVKAALMTIINEN
jgi:hypothetical protein